MIKKIVTTIGISFSLLTSSAFADDYPNKNIEIIVGWNAGGGTDVMARSVAPILAKHLGNDVKISIKNQPGAGGQIALTELSKSKPDGYTLGTSNLPSMAAKLYDRKPDFTLDSFTFLSSVVEDPNVLIVRKDSPFKTLEDAIAAAKEAPGSVTYGIAGLGGDDHFAAVLLENAAGVDFNVIPFGSTAPARAAILGGHASLGGVNLGEVTDFKDQIRILAVFSDERSTLDPDAPTAKEQGYDAQMASIRGIVAPAGLPEEVTAKLVTAFEATAQDPDFLALSEKQGLPLRVITGQNYRNVADEQSKVAEKIWTETPWKK